MKKLLLLLLLTVVLLISCREKQPPVITYDYSYDKKSEQYTVHNGVYPIPDDPERFGYEFSGWYSDGLKWDFTEEVKDDITIFAVWEPCTSVLTLDADGGSCEITSITVRFGEYYEIPLPKKDGYYFDGWRLSGHDLTSGIWDRIGDFPLSAKWSSFPPGKTVIFGKFEQDGNDANGKENIIWDLISEQDGKYLIFSKYILTGMKYKKPGQPTEWKTSLIREWLNGEFLASAFTEDEKSHIVDTYFDDTKTRDSIFLLSRKEVTDTDDYIIYGGIPTQYAIMNGVEVQNYHYDRNTTWFYTREGNSFDSGTFAYGTALSFEGIRPALWVDKSFFD